MPEGYSFTASEITQLEYMLSIMNLTKDHEIERIEYSFTASEITQLEYMLSIMPKEREIE